MRDIAALKRVRPAGAAGSAAERLFHRAWAALLAGRDPADVAVDATAAGLVGARMGALDGPAMSSLGLAAGESLGICRRALHESGPETASRFERGLAAEWPDTACPPFVAALCAQPRAGATRPGHHRLVLLPAESHGDHCLLVAVGGVLLADLFAADAGTVFLAGLAHHLHNARMPDSGFEGEELLGDALSPLVERLTKGELATLPPGLAAATARALDRVRAADNAEGQAFHAADVLDRVLQVHYHAAVAGFRADQALDDMQIVHAGPVQAFHAEILRAAELA